jgi:hypothetical protein
LHFVQQPQRDKVRSHTRKPHPTYRSYRNFIESHNITDELLLWPVVPREAVVFRNSEWENFHQRYKKTFTLCNIHLVLHLDSIRRSFRVTTSISRTANSITSHLLWEWKLTYFVERSPAPVSAHKWRHKSYFT